MVARALGLEELVFFPGLSNSMIFMSVLGGNWKLRVVSPLTDLISSCAHAARVSLCNVLFL